VPHTLVEEIEQSNHWRDGEFAKFKVNPANLDEKLWCRMCVPMIYAHWEGFVVSSIKELLKYINNCQLTPNRVPTRLIVHCFDDSYKTLGGKQSFSQRVEFTNKFKELKN